METLFPRRMGCPVPIPAGPVTMMGIMDSSATRTGGTLAMENTTAVVYDDGTEFDRSTFTVTTLGTEFLTGANTQVSIPDFPTPGETTTFRVESGDAASGSGLAGTGV